MEKVQGKAAVPLAEHVQATVDASRSTGACEDMARTYTHTVLHAHIQDSCGSGANCALLTHVARSHWRMVAHNSSDTEPWLVKAARCPTHADPSWEFSPAPVCLGRTCPQHPAPSSFIHSFIDASTRCPSPVMPVKMLIRPRASIQEAAELASFITPTAVRVTLQKKKKVCTRIPDAPCRRAPTHTHPGAGGSLC